MRTQFGLLIMHNHKALVFSVSALLVTIGRGDILYTAQGMLQGVNSADGSYISYNGIPYAGNASRYRFRRAGPAAAWSGVRDAQHERPSCVSSSGSAVTGEEDCLFLNVHTPTARKASSVVLVWLHGGGFLSGSATSQVYDPVNFTRRGIIVVAVNYRLGPLGFLCLGTEQAPGNAGSKDALLALRWVQDNIVAFGGDAKRVTLGGDGSGAAVAEALVLSPASEGLIRSAILQSGTVLSAWAYNYDAADRAKGLAKYFTNSQDIDELAESLLKTSSTDLTSKSIRLDFEYFPFALCAEKGFKNEERLLDKPPMDILGSKQFKSIPILMGFSSHEAYVLAPTLSRAEVSRKAQRDFSYLIPEELRFVSQSELKQVAERIRKNYFSSGTINASSLIEYYSEVHFAGPVLRSAQLHAAASDLPVYLYQFMHLGKLGVPEVDGVEKEGPTHSDELAYLFTKDENMDEADREVQEKLVTLWKNFMNDGNPTPEATFPDPWEPLKTKELRIYGIGDGGKAKMTSIRNNKRLLVWKDIYDKYYYRRIGH